MVCVRCKMAVEEVLKANGVAYSIIELGWAKLENPLAPAQKEKVCKGLKRYELELM